MIYRFNKQFKALTGFLFEAKDRGKFLYFDPITGEVLKLKRKNLYQIVGYPGTSLWHRAPLPGREAQPEGDKPVEHDAYLDLDEEGFLIIKMKDGRIIEHGKTRRFVQISKDIEKYRGFMLDRIAQMRTDLKVLLDVHLQAIPPSAPKIVHPEVFYEPYPLRPSSGRLWIFGIMTLILIGCFALPKVESPVLLALALSVGAMAMFYLRIKSGKDFEKMLDKWEQQKLNFELKQKELVDEWNQTCQGSDHNATLLMALDSFDWPRETIFDFEFKNGCEELHLDLDLPDWDKLPYQTWRVGRDNVTLERGRLDPLARREVYVRHVHSLVFLAASAAFWAIPNLKTLFVSAYCENYQVPKLDDDDPQNTPMTAKEKKKNSKKAGAAPNTEAGEPAHEPGTGRPCFLVSVEINREQWEKIAFDNLENIDPVLALEDFKLKRELDKETMVLSEITPF